LIIKNINRHLSTNPALSKKKELGGAGQAKIATQVLQDGDLVEVDANKGVVKIIKKAIT